MLAALAAAVALSGCADVDFSSQQAWFAKPLDVLGRNGGGYQFSELQETKQRQKPIGANDLVSSNGTCPAPAAAPAPPPAPGQAAMPPAPADTSALLGTGVALGMSECDVVFRAGQPGSVQIGSKPNGDRTAILTYNQGPRPGIYHFERGALVEMDRLPTAATPPPTAKKKSPKPSKSAKTQKKNDQT